MTITFRFIPMSSVVRGNIVKLAYEVYFFLMGKANETETQKRAIVLLCDSLRGGTGSESSRASTTLVAARSVTECL